MFRPNSIILYVRDVPASTAFYTRLLGREPVEMYQDFSGFVLNGDFILGLRVKDAIVPQAQPAFGGFELCLADVGREAVDALYAEWRRLGVGIALEPAQLEFGYSFVGLDPDGHRLRVCAIDTSGLE